MKRPVGTPPNPPVPDAPSAPSVNRAPPEISAELVHELHGSLVAISSAAQLLRFCVEDDPVVEKNVGRILHEVDRLNEIAAMLEKRAT
jgi:hypothetical protein